MHASAHSDILRQDGCQQTSPSLLKNSHDSHIIKLNVGGVVFDTTAETLNAAGPSFFSSILSGTFGVSHDERGRIFIDRDPKMFRYVLNYLRSQCTQPIKFEEKSKYYLLHAEATFYQIESLIVELEARIEKVENKGKQAVRSSFPDWHLGKASVSASAPKTSCPGPAQGPSDASPDAQVPQSQVGVDPQIATGNTNAPCSSRVDPALITMAANDVDMFDF